MNRLATILNTLQDRLLALLLAVMIFVVLLATLCRYTGLAVLEWPDEMARYLMIWLVFIGCGAAAREGAHFVIEALFNLFPAVTKKALIIVRSVITSGMMLFIIYLSINITRKQMLMQQISPAMKIPMWGMYLAVPLGCLLIIVQGLAREVRIWKSLENEGADKKEYVHDRHAV